MINTKVYLYQPISVGDGKYDIYVYFQDSSKAQHLNIGDTVVDTNGNRYEAIDLSIPFSDGSVVTFRYLTTDTLPAEDSDYNSIISSNTFDPLPAYRVLGMIYDVQYFDPTNYEYSIRFAPNYAPDANLVEIGDSLVDSGGKEFEILYIPPNKFDDEAPFRVKEVELMGLPPIENEATLYRATTSHRFFQGTELSDPARNVIQGRDIKKIDMLLSSGGGILAAFYDDLSSQIDGIKDTFIVSATNYAAGTLAVSIGGVFNQKGYHYFEEDPATGLIRFAIPPTVNDAPIVAQYQYNS